MGGGQDGDGGGGVGADQDGGQGRGGSVVLVVRLSAVFVETWSLDTESIIVQAQADHVRSETKL